MRGARSPLETIRNRGNGPRKPSAKASCSRALYNKTTTTGVSRTKLCVGLVLVMFVMAQSVPLVTTSALFTTRSGHNGEAYSITQATPPSQAPFDYIVVIVMNNASSSIYGDSDAPYLNSLANTYSYATSYSSLAQYAVPNYLALTAGDTLVSAECDPTQCPINAVNIIDRIEGAGLTWRAWAEDYPSSQGCSLSLTNAGYIARHFPFVYFQDIIDNPTRCNNLRTANSVVSSSIETDDLFLQSLGSTSSAANFMWLSPNKCDDFHDCPVSTGDTYLSRLVPSILSSYIFKTQKAALFIVSAEGIAKSCPCPTDYVPSVWAGPAAKTSFQSSSQYDHYSFLKTIETSWALSPITSNDDSASPMSEFLKPAGPQLSLAFTPTSPLTTDSITFTATASGGTAPYTFSWNFGDTTSNKAGGSTNPNLITLSYSSSGSYTVSVNATDSTGKLGSTSASITVVAPLSATITGPASAIVGASVTFTATTTGGTLPYSLSWNFGDGSSNLVTSKNSSSHTYSTAGTFIVTISVTDAKARPATASITIVINPPVLTVIISGPSSGEQGIALDLTATVTGGTPPYSSYAWSLGDGSTSQGSSLSHTYTTLGTYSVRVTATDSVGNTATSPIFSLVIVPPLQISSVQGTPNPTDAGSPVSFTGAISGGVTPMSCKWAFGDSATANTCSASHAYFTSGSFVAVLTVTDSLGIIATSNVTVTVNPAFTVLAFASPNPQPIVGGTVNFNATTSGGISPVSCNWDYGDGTVFAGCATTHSYLVQGTYTATITATDALGTITKVSVTLQVGSPLAVTLNVSPSPTEQAVSTTFTATPTGGTFPYLSYTWDFGDGASIITAMTTTIHTYTSTGSFTVIVTVTDSAGRIATVSAALMVNPKLSATAGSSPNPAEITKAVTFSSSSSGGVGTISCNWSFGDGVTATTCSPTHIYSTNGTYSVTLIVTDGLRVNATSTISLTVNPKLTITAAAGPNPTELTKAINLSGTAASGVGTVSCSWNFGDGSLGTGCSTGHTYTIAGTFTATVNATDSLGIVAVNRISVVVKAKLAVRATAIPSPTDEGVPVSFAVSPSGGVAPLTCSWNFGDGSRRTGCNSSNTYNSFGSFVVNVTAIDSLGAISNASLTLTVDTPPTVDFASSTTNPTANQSLTFTATTFAGTAPFSLSWNFGDGVTGSGNPISHSFAGPGTFAVSLTVVDASGKAVSIGHSVTVIAEIPPIFSSLPGSETVNVGDSLNFTVAAFDPQGGQIAISAQAVPTGAHFDSTTGKFNWTPTADETGSYPVTFTATSSSLPSRNSSLTLVILVRPAENQSCQNCSILGLPLNNEFVAGVTVLGVISTLIVSIFIGTRDKEKSGSHDDEEADEFVHDASHNPVTYGASQSAIDRIASIEGEEL